MPGYEQKAYTDEEKRNRLRLIASPDGDDGSVLINQDARVYVSVIEPGHKVVHQLAPRRHAWIQVARGRIAINSDDLNQGDGAAISGESSIAIAGREPAEVLLFDLA